MITSLEKRLGFRSRTNPLSRRRSWLLHGTVLLLVAPLFLVAFSVMAVNHSHAPGSTAALAVLVFGALGWVLWRGALAGPLFLLVLGSTLLFRSGERVYLLEFGRKLPVHGISVYCNDVFLGKTPFTISEAQFRRAVPPWTNPPVQPRVDWGRDAGESSRYLWAKFIYVPQDIFEMHQTWPPDHFRYGRHQDAEMLSDFARSRYWWRFEKNGAIGLAPTAQFAGGGGGGTVYRIHASPQITFPSTARHLELLLTSLRASDYIPSEEWLAHLGRHAELLFLDFWKAARTDPRLDAALEEVVRARYEVPAQISRADAGRVIESVLRRVEEQQSFVIPSLESEAVKLAGHAQPELLAEYFLKELGHVPRSGGRASSDSWSVHYTDVPRQARFLPLRHAVAAVRPESLFDNLAYHSARGELLEIVGNYPGEKAARLVEYHLRNLPRMSRGRQHHRTQRWLEQLSEITHPELEPFARQFVQEHGRDRMMRHHVRNFVASRIKSEQFANDELAGWIFHFAPLDDREKVELFAQLQAPASAHYLRMLLGRNSSFQDEALSVLAHNPNPHHDQFLIQTFEWERSPRGRGYSNTALTLALLKTDTEAVGGFLEKLWHDERPLFLQRFGRVQLEGTHEHLNWLAAAAARLENPRDKESVLPLLAGLNSDQAWALIRDWAGVSDQQLALAVANELDRLKSRAEQQAEDLQLARALLSGELDPGHLLPPAQPHVWTEAGYVPKAASP